jgi:WD40 repeat protein
MRCTIALTILALAGSAAGAPADKTAQEVAHYVKQLGDKDFRAREEAARRLRAIGEPALDALDAATKSEDPEVVQRARDLIAAIEKTVKAEARQFLGHTDQILCVAFDAAGQRIASGGFDKTIRVWDVATGKQLLLLDGHKDIVFSVAFSPDGKHLLSASGGNREGGKWSEGEDHTFRLWDLATGKEVRRFGEPMDWALCGAFSPDGKLIATGTRNKDPSVRLWDPATGKEVKRLTGHGAGVRSVSFSPDGKTLASAGYDQSVRLWDVPTGTEKRLLRGHGGWIDRVVFSPDGKTLLTSSRDNTLRWWDAATGTELRSINGHTDHVLCVAFAADGKRAVSCSGDRTVRVWDLKTGDEVKRLEGHTSVIDALAVSPDGRFVASGSADRTVRLWKLPR